MHPRFWGVWPKKILRPLVTLQEQNLQIITTLATTGQAVDYFLFFLMINFY